MPPDPRSNPALFGHRAAQATFDDALSAGRLHHAWLLAGPPGIGKATLAFRLARLLLAPGVDPGDPATPSFRRVAAGSHADLLTIARERDEKTKRLRQAIGVDQVRDVPAFLHLTPAEGGWRVVIVDGAEDMNRNAANALLKVLEEPSSRAVLLLTVDAPGRLLPTIRSRCRRLRLDPLGAPEMDAALGHLLPELDGQGRGALAAAAAGSPGRAMELAEDGTLALAQLAAACMGAGVLGITRMHTVADQVVKLDTGFTTFMTMLRDQLSVRVRTEAAAGQGSRPLADQVDLWHGLARLQDETERFNLDKRTAVIAGLELLSNQ